MISGHSNMLARGGIVIHLKRDECVEIDCSGSEGVYLFFEFYSQCDGVSCPHPVPSSDVVLAVR